MKITSAKFDEAIAAALHALESPEGHSAFHAYVSYTLPSCVLIDGDVDIEAVIRAALIAAGVEIGEG